MGKSGIKKSTGGKRTAFDGQAKVILIRIADNNFLTTTQIVEIMNAENQRWNISTYVTRLRDAGFLKTTLDHSDRRIKYHSLTPKGRAYLDDLLLEPVKNDKFCDFKKIKKEIVNKEKTKLKKIVNKEKTKLKTKLKKIVNKEKTKLKEIVNKEKVRVKGVVDREKDKLILVQIAKNKRLIARDLASLMSLSVASVNVSLGLLVKAGFLDVNKDFFNKRKSYYNLTKKGLGCVDEQMKDSIKPVKKKKPELASPVNFDQNADDLLEETQGYF